MFSIYAGDENQRRLGSRVHSSRHTIRLVFGSHIAGLRVGMGSGSGSDIQYVGDTAVSCLPPQARSFPKWPSANPFAAFACIPRSSGLSPTLGMGRHRFRFRSPRPLGLSTLSVTRRVSFPVTGSQFQVHILVVIAMVIAILITVSRFRYFS